MKKLLVVIIAFLLVGCSNDYVEYEGAKYELKTIYTFDDGREYKLYRQKLGVGEVYLESLMGLETYDEYGLVLYTWDTYYIVEYLNEFYKIPEIIDYLESDYEFTYFGSIEKYYTIISSVQMSNGDLVEMVEYTYDIERETQMEEDLLPARTKYFVNGVEINVLEQPYTIYELWSLDIPIEMPVGGN